MPAENSLSSSAQRMYDGHKKTFHSHVEVNTNFTSLSQKTLTTMIYDFFLVLSYRKTVELYCQKVLVKLIINLRSYERHIIPRINIAPFVVC